LGLFLRLSLLTVTPGKLVGLHDNMNRKMGRLLPDDFDQNPLLPPAIKLAVEDLLPRAEVELALCDGNNYLPPHDLPFQMTIGIIFTSIVSILRNRFVWGKLFEPYFKVIVKARFIIIDKNRSRDVHGV
jgi:hypothetical protein